MFNVDKIRRNITLNGTSDIENYAKIKYKIDSIIERYTEIAPQTIMASNKLLNFLLIFLNDMIHQILGCFLYIAINY